MNATSAAVDGCLRDTILALARAMVAEDRQALDWYHGDGIHHLDGLTAAELVALGRGGQVLGFLAGIVACESKDGRQDGRRGAA